MLDPTTTRIPTEMNGLSPLPQADVTRSVVAAAISPATPAAHHRPTSAPTATATTEMSTRAIVVDTILARHDNDPARSPGWRSAESSRLRQALRELPGVAGWIGESHRAYAPGAVHWAV